MDNEKHIYELMHKNLPVLQFEMEDYNILNITKVLNLDHAPVGTTDKFGVVKKKLNQWYSKRSIPASRDNIEEILQTLNLDSPKELLQKAYALSLSDQYWIKPIDTQLSWEKVNFFNNTFSDDLGELLLGTGKVIDSEKLSMMSPDASADGWLKKRWKIVDGDRCLIKSGSGINLQEPLNEVIATALCERLGIKHISYELQFGRKGEPYSICRDYITQDTELITAYAMSSLIKQRNDESDYEHYIRVCKAYGIDDITERIDEMLCVDYIMANEDRHWGNFGVIRNANTLEYMEVMPIYDTGSSLWYKTPDYAIAAEPVKGQMLKRSLEEHLKFVQEPSFLQFGELIDFADEAMEIFQKSPSITKTRSEKIGQALKERIKQLEQILLRKDRTKFFVQDKSHNLERAFGCKINTEFDEKEKEKSAK